MVFKSIAWLRCGTDKVNCEKAQKFPGCSAPSVQMIEKMNKMIWIFEAGGKNTIINQNGGKKIKKEELKF